MIEDDSRDNKLAEIGCAIGSKRDEAVDAVKASGMPSIWSKCEANYLGIDAANRGEFTDARWVKPTALSGPMTTEGKSSGHKSTAFVRLTSRYVNAAAAKAIEITQPVDDKPFAFGPTPVVELVTPAKPVAAPVAPPPPQPGQPPAPPVVPPTPAELTLQQLKQTGSDAASASEKAAQRVYDWLVEACFSEEAGKALHDKARLGTGILKGPIARMRKSQAVKKTGTGVDITQVEKVVPAVCWVDPWNLFPDPACGENVHDGDYIIERDFLSRRSLKKLKRDPGYIGSQIDKVLEEGPGKCDADNSDREIKGSKHRFEVWYYYGTVNKEDLETTFASANGSEDMMKLMQEEGDEYFAIITLVNDSVIRATLNPLESGKFPYHVMNWQRRAGHWAGVGIAEQVFMPQESVNAATRALFNNAGLSSGVQIILDQTAVIPADSRWEITPNKIWFMTGDAAERNVRNAFNLMQFPNIGAELMNIINYASKLAEESTNLPLLSQGQTGERMPDTFGATSLLDDNANTLLRAVGGSYDIMLNALIKQFYEWLLLDPEVPDDEKGDYQINTKGAALVERAIQEQTLGMIGQMVVNPAFGIDPKKWFAEFMKSKRLNPELVQFSEEDLEKQKAMAPPPPPQIQAMQMKLAADQQKVQFQAQQQEKIAQMEMQLEMEKLKFTQQHDQQKSQFTAQTAMQIAAQREATAQERIRVDTDRDTVYVQAEAARSEAAHQIRVAELQLQRELKMLEYANKQNISLEQVKAQLAMTAAKLETQKELTQMAMVEGRASKAPQVVAPPTEPPGRADNGQAYQE